MFDSFLCMLFYCAWSRWIYDSDEGARTLTGSDYSSKGRTAGALFLSRGLPRLSESLSMDLLAKSMEKRGCFY